MRGDRLDACRPLMEELITGGRSLPTWHKAVVAMLSVLQLGTRAIASHDKKKTHVALVGILGCAPKRVLIVIVCSLGIGRAIAHDC